MATHDQILPARKFRRTNTLVFGIAITLGMSLLGSLPAHASPDPAPPTTSTDAKTAWANSARQAEIASEQVNGAEQAQSDAVKADRQAAVDLIAARKRLTSTQQVAADAAANVASFQAKLDSFANASFRGAQLSQFSVMLTARSADDFLDESTVINRVAQDTQHTLDAAVAAQNAASAAKSAAEAAQTAAITAKTGADQASTAAAAATVTAQAKKVQLDSAVVKYKDLYNKLSAQEKAAAAAAAELARQQSLAAAAAAAAQLQAAAEAAKLDAASSSSSSASAASALAAASSADAVKAGSSSSSSVLSPAAVAAATTSTAATTSSAARIQGGDAAGQAAAAAALTKVGFSYVYGATGPDSFDCSGLTSWAWAQAGISLPRASYEQANLPEVSLDQLQPGDLVTYYSPVSHVAIYVGNGMVVSAADEELGVIYVPVDRGGPDPTGHRVPR